MIICTTKVRENSIPLTPEHPERPMTYKDLTDRAGLHLIEHVKSAFVLTCSQGGQESPTAAGTDTVAEGILEVKSLFGSQPNYHPEADLMLLKNPNKNSLAQGWEEEISLVGCFVPPVQPLYYLLNALKGLARIRSFYIEKSP